jgi:hypothetical protein
VVKTCLLKDGINFHFLFGVFPVEMDNEELGRKVRQLYNEFNKMMLKQGYDEVSLEDFLEWIKDMIDDPYDL